MKRKIKKVCLLGIAEIYLLLRNTWGLTTHPYKTLRQIRLQKDFSQAFLVLGLPFYLWLALAFLFVIVKLVSLFVVQIPPPFGLLGLIGFAFATFVLVLAEFYIFFWLVYYLKVKRRTRKELKNAQ